MAGMNGTFVPRDKKSFAHTDHRRIILNNMGFCGFVRRVSALGHKELKGSSEINQALSTYPEFLPIGREIGLCAIIRFLCMSDY